MNINKQNIALIGISCDCSKYSNIEKTCLKSLYFPMLIDGFPCLIPAHLRETEGAELALVGLLSAAQKNETIQNCTKFECTILHYNTLKYCPVLYCTILCCTVLPLYCRDHHQLLEGTSQRYINCTVGTNEMAVFVSYTGGGN